MCILILGRGTRPSLDVFALNLDRPSVYAATSHELEPRALG